jgi:hypothetical protein
MHSAPALSYPVGRSVFWGFAMLLAALSAVFAGLAWLNRSHPDLWKQWVFLLTLLGACLLSVRAWWREAGGSLRWDGQVWTWSQAQYSESVNLVLRLDLQFCMLLQLSTKQGGQHWIWPQRHHSVALWRPLRRAVYFSAMRKSTATIDAQPDL